MRVLLIALGLVASSTAYAQSDEDAQAWTSALTAGTAQAFSAYLEARPDGRFAGLAFRCAIELNLMPRGHRCSVENTEPGPVGPVRVQSGNFPVSLR